jgi:hypothetical protein
MSVGLSRGSFVKVAPLFYASFMNAPLLPVATQCSVAVGVVRFLNRTLCHAASAGFGAEPQGLSSAGSAVRSRENRAPARSANTTKESLRLCQSALVGWRDPATT